MHFRDTDLSDIIRTKLCPDFPVKSFGKNEIIFLKDDAAHDVYFVESGSAKAVNFEASGKSFFFMEFKPGDIFGYYASMMDKPRTATMVSVTDTKVRIIPVEKFMNFVTSTPAFASTMMIYMAADLRQNTLRLSRNATMAAPERVAAFLAFMMQENGRGKLQIQNREDFASQLDMTRETLSRILNKLAKEDIISIAPDFIEIKNLPLLYEMIAQE